MLKEDDTGPEWRRWMRHPQMRAAVWALIKPHGAEQWGPRQKAVGKRSDEEARRVLLDLQHTYPNAPPEEVARMAGVSFREALALAPEIAGLEASAKNS